MSPKHNSATQRLKQDYLRLKRDPVPYIVAEPLPSNILEWHYVVTGPEDSPYEGGLYHGKLGFPSEFPYKPPTISIITPNGRFKTNTRLCLSISDFHPDTWNPSWSVATILTGLLSFMLEKSPTLGSIESSDYEKRRLAYQSLEFNLHDKIFQELFPEMVEKIHKELDRRKKAEANRSHEPPSEQITEHGSTGMMAYGGPVYSFLSNVAVIFGFAVFALTVKYVLKTTESDI